MDTPSTLPKDLVECRHAIWRMFRDAADEDYLLARFSARSSLIYQFWWNAQQTIEKYLKAILLLNGYPTNAYGHSLVQMFDLASEIAGDLLPVLSCPPRSLNGASSFDRSTRGFQLSRDFIATIEDNGNPNNRYRMYSTHVTGYSLVVFDELSFMLRRVAFPLDLQLSELGDSPRKRLQENRTLQLHSTMAFEKGLSAKYDSVWQGHFRWCNFAYFEKEAVEAREFPSWGGIVNAAPYLALENPSSEQLQSMEWIANACFPPAPRKDVLSRIENFRSNQIAKRKPKST